MSETLNIINIIAISQSVFLGMILIYLKNNIVSNRILAALLIAVSMGMLMNYFLNTHNLTATYYLLYINFSFYLLYGPLIYLYTLSITDCLKKPLSGYSWHFIPFAIFLSYLIIRHRVIEWNGTINLFPFRDNSRLVSYPNLVTLFLVIILCYIYRSLFVIRKYKQRLKNYFSDVDKMSLVWLSMLLAGASVFVILLIAFLVLFRDLSKNYSNSNLVLMIYITYLATVYMVTFFTIRYPEIFNSNRTDVMKENGVKAPKYEKLRLDDDLHLRYSEKLLQHMRTAKPYLNDSLSLRDLAAMLNIPHYHLSIIINSDFRQNFYTFINSYRIDEAKKMLNMPEHKSMNILNIAFNSGFNSKTTFNTIFKQMTGMTPTEFRKTSGTTGQ